MASHQAGHQRGLAESGPGLDQEIAAGRVRHELLQLGDGGLSARKQPRVFLDKAVKDDAPGLLDGLWSKQPAVPQAHEKHGGPPIDVLIVEEQQPRFVERAVHEPMLQETPVEVRRELPRHVHGHCVLHGDHGRHPGLYQFRPQPDERILRLGIALGALAGRKKHQVRLRIKFGNFGNEFRVLDCLPNPFGILQIERGRTLAALALAAEMAMAQEMEHMATGEPAHQVLLAGRTILDLVSLAAPTRPVIEATIRFGPASASPGSGSAFEDPPGPGEDSPLPSRHRSATGRPAAPGDWR